MINKMCAIVLFLLIAFSNTFYADNAVKELIEQSKNKEKIKENFLSNCIKNIDLHGYAHEKPKTKIECETLYIKETKSENNDK